MIWLDGTLAPLLFTNVFPRSISIVKFTVVPGHC